MSARGDGEQVCGREQCRRGVSLHASLRVTASLSQCSLLGLLSPCSKLRTNDDELLLPLLTVPGHPNHVCWLFSGKEPRDSCFLPVPTLDSSRQSLTSLSEGDQKSRNREQFKSDAFFTAVMNREECEVGKAFIHSFAS